MVSRRQMRAGTAPGTAAAAVPAYIARFDAADWPPARDEPDAPELVAVHDGMARFLARQRWHRAQREYAAGHGMTISELWHLIGANSR